MVVRDGSDASGGPLEVLMVRRSPHTEFVGGAHVFPGGAVDPRDRGRRAERLCCGRSDADASRILGIGSGGLAYWVAAIRECFEEAGLLLACGESGAPLSLADHDIASRFARYRAGLHARAQTFLDICEAEGLRLLAGRLSYFAHWITPQGSSRRYDTRFFVTAAPGGQSPSHDGQETVAHLWVRPAKALELHRSGKIDLVLPTIRNLQAIGAFATTAELLDAAASARDVPTVLPRAVDSGGARLLHPGDPSDLDPTGAPLRRDGIDG
jgi:8-oxo-dGTP pyrophosphatase MutT (NUDIX family)